MTREEAIKHFEFLKVIRSDVYINHDALDMAIDALNKEPKSGHWVAQNIHNCHTDFKCSECGYIHNFSHLYGEPTADYTYCPNCGAKMVELQEAEEEQEPCEDELDFVQPHKKIPVNIEIKQEPCTDAVSRQEVINSFKNWLNDNKDPRSFEEVIKEMPSAISGQKEGDS